MLENNTAYPITLTNINVLSHLSGRSPKTLAANLGWCATYSEDFFPRWALVPKTVVIRDMGFLIDTVSFP